MKKMDDIYTKDGFKKETKLGMIRSERMETGECCTLVGLQKEINVQFREVTNFLDLLVDEGAQFDYIEGNISMEDMNGVREQGRLQTHFKVGGNKLTVPIIPQYPKKMMMGNKMTLMTSPLPHPQLLNPTNRTKSS